jgi:Flp pilus assembly pilin Flp
MHSTPSRNLKRAVQCSQGSCTQELHGSSREPYGCSQKLYADSRGVVFVEYVIVLVLVSTLGVAGIIPLGVALSHYFKSQQSVLTLPFP